MRFFERHRTRPPEHHRRRVAPSLALFALAASLTAGTYEGLEPGSSSRADVDGVLGAPIREVEPGTRYEYDPADKGRRISIVFRAEDQVVDSIELEPGGLYARSDYAEWFQLGKATVAELGDDGKWTELYLTQGVSLHFSGPTETHPVVYFKHFDRAALLGEDEKEVAGGRVVGTEVSGAVTAAGGTAGSDEICKGIEGVWRWFNGVMVECFAEGNCVATNGFNAEWECLNGKGRFELRWARPGQQVPYVDKVELSADGWELAGVNQSGQGVGGTRPDFAAGEPPTGCEAILGTWNWSGGAVVECLDDGTCTSSHGLAGRWRCITKSGRFELRWSRGNQVDAFIDTVLISPLGSYLSGKNQYGVAMGATRK